MYEIGDNIIYPMHGAGIIEGIEEKEIQGETRKYYVIKMALKQMQVLIPFKTISTSSVRMVADHHSMEMALDMIQHSESDQSLTWKQRYKLNTEKMKSGKLKEGAEVVRDLMRIQLEKVLNSSEKQMLDHAKGILVSELGLVNGITETQATDLLKKSIQG